MSYFEFQISTPRFLTAQRNVLRQLAVCPPLLPSVDGVQIVVDRIDVGASSLRHDETADFDLLLDDQAEVVRATPGIRTQLAQDIVLQLTTDAEIHAKPNGTPALVPLRVTLVYDISAYSALQDCRLVATLDRFEIGPLPPLPPPLPATMPPAVTAALNDYLSTQLRLLAPSGNVPMGLDQLGLGVRFLNAGVSVDTTGQTLAIRVQIGGDVQTGRGTRWSNFFYGAFPDHRQGHDWALFVEAGYITETVETMLGDQIPRDDDLEAYPGCTYAAEAGKAVLDINALLIYHALEIDALDIDITAEADPHVVLRLSAETTNWLSCEIDFSGLLQAKGALSNFVLSLVRTIGLPAEQLLLRLAGSAAVEALQGGPVDVVKQTSETTIRVDKRIPVPSVPGTLQTSMTDLLALPDGIALAGSMNVSELTSAVASVGVSQFKVRVPDVSCGPASMSLVALFRSDPSAFAVLHASAQILNQGTAPLRLCQPPAPEPAGGPLQPRNIRVDAVPPPIDLRFDIAAPDAAYFQNPFPLDVLVRTNGGTRLIRLNPPPFVDAATYERLAGQLLVEIGNCVQLVDPWFKTHRGYNPRWSPRPPEDFAVEHRWEVVISGLPAGDGAALFDPKRRLLVSAVSAGAPVRLVTVTAPAARGREISIERISDSGREAPGNGRGLQIRQTNLMVDGGVDLHGDCRRIIAATVAGAPAVVALLDDRLIAFDVLSPSPAASLAVWPGRFDGMLRSRNGMVVYGEDGLGSVDASGRMTRALDEPVLDVTQSADRIFAVTRDRVVILSPQLRPRGELQGSDVTSAGHARGQLVLGHRDGIDLVDSGRERNRVADGEVVSLTPASVAHVGALLATFADSSAKLVVPREGRLHELASYDTAPWFKHTVQIGDRLVRIGASADRLELLRLGASVVL